MKNLVKSYRNYWVEDVSFIALSVVLFFTIFVLPVLVEMRYANTLLLNIILTAVFFVGIGSALDKTWIIISTVLFVTHVVLKWIRFSNLPLEYALIERFVMSLNILAFIIVNFRLLFRDQDFNIYRIVGAVNVYLLFAFWGAFQFQLIHMLLGESIHSSLPLTGDDEDYAEYIYFSLASLTTVGYGDYYPLNPAARMLSVFLSSVGIIYPAVVIERLLSFKK